MSASLASAGGSGPADPGMRILPVGDAALLVELHDLEETLGLLAALAADPVPGVVEVVPAARTLLISFDPHEAEADVIVDALLTREASSVSHENSRLVEIPVEYRGEDLAEVAAHLGITQAELVRRHTGSRYRVAFTGFAPGFAYLVGGHPSLDVPRRSMPRTRIPAGAVALAGTYSGVYPRESPGGWQLIGRTELALWDVDREPAALLQPGDHVQFVDVTHRPSKSVRSTPEAARSRAVVNAVGADGALEVASAGAQVLLQDLGRRGRASMGVSRSGALDARSLREANRIVGNNADEPCLEVAYGGLSVVSRGETVVSITGAVVPITIVRRSGRTESVHDHRAVALADGDRLTLGSPLRGIRNYLAVRGGFIVASVLGSASTDSLSGVGPDPVGVGDILPVRAIDRGHVAVAANAPWADHLLPGGEAVLPLMLGPRADWFTEDAVDLLLGQEWEVTAQSNRVGLRLAGDRALTRAITEELPSEGTIAGAIQVPASGQPVLFLADHPVTGGYPVIGVVRSDRLGIAGQLPVGAQIRFEVSTSAAAPASRGDRPGSEPPARTEEEADR